MNGRRGSDDVGRTYEFDRDIVAFLRLWEVMKKRGWPCLI